MSETIGAIGLFESKRKAVVITGTGAGVIFHCPTQDEITLNLSFTRDVGTDSITFYAEEKYEASTWVRVQNLGTFGASTSDEFRIPMRGNFFRLAYEVSGTPVSFSGSYAITARQKGRIRTEQPGLSSLDGF